MTYAGPRETSEKAGVDLADADVLIDYREAGLLITA
jgi:hypothetical protein